MHVQKNQSCRSRQEVRDRLIDLVGDLFGREVVNSTPYVHALRQDLRCRHAVSTVVVNMLLISAFVAMAVGLIFDSVPLALTGSLCLPLIAALGLISSLSTLNNMRFLTTPHFIRFANDQNIQLSRAN